MKKFDIVISIAIFAVVAIGAFTAFKKVHELKQRIGYLQVSLATAQLPMTPTIIRDSIYVVDQQAVEVARRRLDEALAREKSLLKELDVARKQLQSMQTTVIVTADTVPAKVDTADSVYYYNDQWADIRLQVKDTTFYYNIRDSLSTIVYREYKHKFLWWRWGTKGYRLKIVNFNPHARVTYNHYIKAE